MQASEPAVHHDRQNNRFEIHIDSYIGELTYTLNRDTITFTHTGVPPAIEGRGIGSLLVKTGFQYARENNLKVRTLCWFVRKYMDRHPESVS